MRKKWVKMILLAFVLPLLTSCWDARDVEERSIITLVFVDKTQDGYAFFIEFAKPSSSSENQGSSKFVFDKSEGSTIVEAREQLDRKSDLPIYLGAVNAVVLTSKMADSGIEEYMYRLREIYDYRKTVSILTTAEPLESFTQIKSEKDGVGATIESTLKSLVDTGQMFTYNLTDILDSLAGPCPCFLLPNMTISGNDIEINGFSVFHSGKCIGFIPAKDSKGIILLLADKPKSFYSVPFENGLATIHTKMKKKELKPTYSEGKVSFHLSLSFEAVLHNISNSMQVTDKQGKQLNENLQMMILQDIADAIQSSQQTFQCDYLDFCTAFRIAYPAILRNMDWHQKYTKAEITIQVTTNLDTTGMLDYVPRNE